MSWTEQFKKYLIKHDNGEVEKLLERQQLFMNSPYVRKAMSLMIQEFVQGEVKEVSQLESDYIEKVKDIVG
jgi:hypothetical protein